MSVPGPTSENLPASFNVDTTQYAVKKRRRPKNKK